MNELNRPGGDAPEEIPDDFLVPEDLEPAGFDTGGLDPGGLGAAGFEPGGLGAPDYMNVGPSVDVSGEEKVNRGNRGMLIVFVIFMIVSGAVGVFAYKFHMKQTEWENKMKTALALPDGQFETAMRDILEKSENSDIAAQAALELGEAKDTSSVGALAKAVTKGGMVGRESAKALAKIGGDEAKLGIEPIFQQMTKSTDLAKAEYAWALCKLGDERGFTPLLEGVVSRIVNSKSLPEFDEDLIVRMGTTDRIIQLADKPDPMLKMYAAMELGFRTDGDVVSPLLKLVTDENNKVAEAAAISLGRTADDRAGPALIAAMKSKPKLKDAILESITQSVGAPGLEMIYKNSQDIDEKYTIIGKLKKLRDPRSKDFLLSVSQEQLPGSDAATLKKAEEIHNQALWILEDLGDSRISELMYEKTRWEPISEAAIPDSAVRYRQDDMSRKIANGVPAWFGKIRPEGAADFLQKIWDDNAPYSNTPECAQRVKVDSGPLMDAMGRSGDQRFCSTVKPFLDQDEGFFFQAAAFAIARLNCDGAIKDFVQRMQITKKEREDEAFAQVLEARDWQMEDRLQERRNSIMALKFLGKNTDAAKKLMEIVMDTKDDQELRTEAAISLAYVADDAAMGIIVDTLTDEKIDVIARADLVQGLWFNPTPAAIEAMFGILEGSAPFQLTKPAAIAIGESADPAYQERLVKLLSNPDDNRKRAALFALMLGGDIEPVLDQALAILTGEEAQLVLKQWWEEHPVYLTKEMVDSKRIYKRLYNAKLIAEKSNTAGNKIIWPWKHLMNRLKTGWDDGPGGLTALEIRDMLMDTVRNDAKFGQMAGDIIAGLQERGYLLALQSEKGPQSDIARNILKPVKARAQ